MLTIDNLKLFPLAFNVFEDNYRPTNLYLHQAAFLPFIYARTFIAFLFLLFPIDICKETPQNFFYCVLFTKTVLCRFTRVYIKIGFTSQDVSKAFESRVFKNHYLKLAEEKGNFSLHVFSPSHLAISHCRKASILLNVYVLSLSQLRLITICSNFIAAHSN